MHYKTTSTEILIRQVDVIGQTSGTVTRRYLVYVPEDVIMTFTELGDRCFLNITNLETECPDPPNIELTEVTCPDRCYYVLDIIEVIRGTNA